MKKSIKIIIIVSISILIIGCIIMLVLNLLNNNTTKIITTGISPAKKNDKILKVSDSSGLSVGDTIIIDKGKPNEETAKVVGFGSIKLDKPLKYDHDLGFTVSTSNTTASKIAKKRAEESKKRAEDIKKRYDDAKNSYEQNISERQDLLDKFKDYMENTFGWGGNEASKDIFFSGRGPYKSNTQPTPGGVGWYDDVDLWTPKKEMSTYTLAGRFSQSSPHKNWGIPKGCGTNPNYCEEIGTHNLALPDYPTDHCEMPNSKYTYGSYEGCEPPRGYTSRFTGTELKRYGFSELDIQNWRNLDPLDTLNNTKRVRGGLHGKNKNEIKSRCRVKRHGLLDANDNVDFSYVPKDACTPFYENSDSVIGWTDYQKKLLKDKDEIIYNKQEELNKASLVYLSKKDNDERIKKEKKEKEEIEKIITQLDDICKSSEYCSKKGTEIDFKGVKYNADQAKHGKFMDIWYDHIDPPGTYLGKDDSDVKDNNNICSVDIKKESWDRITGSQPHLPSVQGKTPAQVVGLVGNFEASLNWGTDQQGRVYQKTFGYKPSSLCEEFFRLKDPNIKLINEHKLERLTVILNMYTPPTPQ